MLHIEPFILLTDYGTNTWLLYDDVSLEGIVVDPAAPSEVLLKRIKDLGLNIKMIINTHGHGDHIGGNAFFAERLRVPLAIHKDDAPMLTDNHKNLSVYMGGIMKTKAADVLLEDGYTLKLGEYELKVIHTPGHTPGGICLYSPPHCFTGDTVFVGAVGRTDFPGGSMPQMIEAIKNRLLTLPPETIVWPGHGYGGLQSTIAREEKTNPYFDL